MFSVCDMPLNVLTVLKNMVLISIEVPNLDNPLYRMDTIRITLVENWISSPSATAKVFLIIQEGLQIKRASIDPDTVDSHQSETNFFNKQMLFWASLSRWEAEAATKTSSYIGTVTLDSHLSNSIRKNPLF